MILAHRLLKNRITEATGIGAYAFFTATCMQRLPISNGLPRHSETYESFGETEGGIHNLRQVADEMRDARRAYVSSEVADYETRIVVSQPPAVVWQYAVDPIQRLRWACVMSNRDPDKVLKNSLGRDGTGAKVHCNHGPGEAYREIIDWRPFAYFSARGKMQLRGKLVPARRTIETYEFAPLDGGHTELSWRLRFVDRGAISMLTLRMIQLLLRGGVGRGGERLEKAILEDLSARHQEAKAP